MPCPTRSLRVLRDLRGEKVFSLTIRVLEEFAQAAKTLKQYRVRRDLSFQTLPSATSAPPRCKLRVLLLVVAVFLFAAIAYSAESQDEWKKAIEAAKKEAKIVAGGPPTAVLRKQYKETFENRFGIELELLSAQGAQNAQRAMAEFKAGVKY